MDLITKSKMILDVLLRVEDLSTCAAKKVGCVLYSNEYNILSYGFNHSISNTNCEDLFKKVDGKWLYYINGKWEVDNLRYKHKVWSVLNEVHAEIDAISYNFPKNDPINAIVTYSPCLDCCKSLINIGVRKITFINDFDDINDIKELCDECNVELRQIDKNSENYKYYIEEKRKLYDESNNN